jgi:FkbM family methyltransferase
MNDYAEPRDLAAIFNDFRVGQVNCPANSEADFVGSVQRQEFLCEPRNTPARAICPRLPGLDHELFEWITLCDAIRAARGSFTFMEIGAGFGRWTASAVCAARRYGIAKIEPVMVEAEPTHCQWALINMADNGIPPGQFELIEAAIAAREGEALFCTASAQGRNPRDFYGQTLMPETVTMHPTPKTYAGHQVFDFYDGWEAIKIKTKPLTAIIGDRPVIDLIDMDIQGAEGEVVASSVALLTERVRRLYIETHSTEVEREIREALAPAGWINVYDFSVGRDCKTPYGTVDFEGGGAQSWANPHLG